MSNFSFLEGASHPAQLVVQAQSLGLAALGLADRNTLAGVVRAHTAAKAAGLPLLIGCRLAFTDATELIVFPRDRAAYGRLCRLLSEGKSERLPGESNVVAFPLPARCGAICSPSPSGEGPGGWGSPSQRGDRPTPGAGASAVSPRPSPEGEGEVVRPSFPPPGPITASDKKILKGETLLTFAQACRRGDGLIALVPAPDGPDAAFADRLAAWAAAWPDALYLAAAPHWRGDDRARLARLAALADTAGAPLVATNLALYHHPDQRRLQDVLTCVRHGCTIDTAGLRLAAHAERHLKPAAEMARLFAGHEDALERTLAIAAACSFSLDELRYDYPDEPVPPGWTPGRHLIRLSFAGARERWPRGIPAKIVPTIVKELRMIRKLRYAAYFLTVHDIVAWAKARPDPILCQGRGSAANSVVCYCLGITAIDPMLQDVLIERFISEERREPPDIDVDFEHERREEVMQYIYRRYGRDRAAIVATVIHYRPRSAIRDVGKALGLSEDVTSRLAGTIWGSFGREIEEAHLDETGIARDDPRLALAIELARQLLDFPRHLSQHVGGFVLTQGPLVETVPVGNGAMADRTFIEWDKDDIDALGIMKVDVLALGMLTALKRGFDMLRDTYGVRGCDAGRLALVEVPQERKRVYDMLTRADSLGVFQVESRAQMAMLPRLRPREFYDLVVEVAIVRPGPIQGKMVHPYLANRLARREAEAVGKPFRIVYPKPSPDHGPADELENILGKTLGVPLFQEQAMRIAMDAAKFSGAEANQLRRAMATFRHVGTIGTLERRMVDRMVARGYDPEFAENCFGQIKGFGEYGFPESHAASFAHLVYASSWLKCDWPDVFAAALLNSQPMGFYAPAQIVRDAREHGIEVRAVDVTASDWDCTLERRGGRRRRALRLGLRMISGFRGVWAEGIVAARGGGPFASMDDLRRRAGLPAAALDKLAGADALGGLDLTRRQGQWVAGGLGAGGGPGGGATRRAPAPLFDFAGLDEGDGAPPPALPVLAPSEEVVGDYRSIRLSLKGHPVAFLRERLAKAGAVPCSSLAQVRDGRRVSVGGVVLVRQRPGTAKGVVFLTIEDETGVANIVVWRTIFEAQRAVTMGARMVVVHGRIQRSDDSEGNVTHLVAERLDDWTPMLGSLDLRTADEVRTPPSRGRHPRDVRILPGSRDFH